MGAVEAWWLKPFWWWAPSGFPRTKFNVPGYPHVQARCHTDFHDMNWPLLSLSKITGLLALCTLLLFLFCKKPLKIILQWMKALSLDKPAIIIMEHLHLFTTGTVHWKELSRKGCKSCLCVNSWHNKMNSTQQNEKLIINYSVPSHQLYNTDKWQKNSSRSA